MNNEPFTLTSLLATYGAVLSSIGLGWNLYRDATDRARLKVRAHLRRIVQAPSGKFYQVSPELNVADASEILYLVVNVTNIGRRQVKWDVWGGRYHQPQDGRRSFVIIPSVIPVMLKEGESASELTPDLAAIGDNVKRLFIEDATGKRWYVSRGNLRELKKDRARLAVPLNPVARD
jgi:hypothetical protein